MLRDQSRFIELIFSDHYSIMNKINWIIVINTEEYFKYSREIICIILLKQLMPYFIGIYYVAKLISSCNALLALLLFRAKIFNTTSRINRMDR